MRGFVTLQRELSKDLSKEIKHLVRGGLIVVSLSVPLTITLECGELWVYCWLNGWHFELFFHLFLLVFVSSLSPLILYELFLKAPSPQDLSSFSLSGLELSQKD